MNQKEIIVNKNIGEDFYRQMLSFVLRRISNKEEAEEVVQEVFLRLVKNIDSIDEERVQSWIFSSARNAIVDFYRKRAKNDALSKELIALDDSLDSEENQISR